MDIGSVATAIAARDAQKIQAEISVKVFRLALDAQASSELALLSAAGQAAGVGTSVNLIA
jgi:hypothetical protein